MIYERISFLIFLSNTLFIFYFFQFFNKIFFCTKHRKINPKSVKYLYKVKPIIRYRLIIKKFKLMKY